MATKNAIFCANPTEIECGGTAKQSFTAYAPVVGGTTSTGALQQPAVGASGNVLVSGGAGAIPAYGQLPTFFEPLATDPVNPAASTVWYNTTTDLFKGALVGNGIWTTVTSMSTGRRGAGASGISTDGLVFGGFSGSYSAVTESYNGSTWSTVNAMNTARNNLGGCGTASSALSFGGQDGGGNKTTTEQWDGSNWTAKNALNTARTSIAGCGTTSAALSFGGSTGSNSAVTEQWDGTNWTSKNSMNTARQGLGGSGTTASAVCYGGFTTVSVTTTETWNGTSWSSANALNTSRYRLPDGENGTSTSALCVGGFTTGPGSSSVTELFDGTNWTAKTSQNSSGDNGSIFGISSSTIQAGANPTSAVSQLYSNADIITFTVT